MILFMMAVMLTQSVDDVVAKAVKARGDIRKVQTQRLTGNISLPSGSGALVVEMKRPGKMREMLTLNGQPHIRTTDGSVAWSGSETIDAKDLAGSADFEGPLVDYKAKGNRIELVGQEKVGDQLAFKLVITMKNGENRVDFVDSKSYLELKWQGKVGDTTFESYFRDYRKVDGLMYAFEIASGVLGQPQNQKIAFDKIEVNPPIDDSRFGKP
jgi:hypothetical protein